MPTITYPGLKARELASVEAAKKIQSAADEADRPITEAEQKEIDGHLAKAKEWNRAAKARLGLNDAETLANERTPNGPLETLEGIRGDIPRVAAEPRDLKAEARHGFGTFGEYAMAVKDAFTPGHRVTDPRLHIGAAATGLNQSVGTDGGFLVPPEFLQTVWDGMNKQPDNLVAMTTSFPVTGDSLTIPANAETSRATGSRFGGVRGYWIDEAAQITASAPKFRQIRGEPHQIAALCYVTDKLLANGPALQTYLEAAMGQELMWLINDSLVNGNGTGKPLGVLSAPCLVSVTKETNQTAATIVYENIQKMWARFHARSRANAYWCINQEVEPQLDGMTLGIGTAGVPVYMPPGGISGAPFGTLKGRPVLPIEFCAALGTKGDIILCDWSQYATFTAGGLQSASTIHLRFDYLETAFRWVTAIDGKPFLASAITPANATSGKTLSPFVTLDARA